jgi:hypothetical protein
MLHEIMHELKKKKMPGVILKIDFEKAYDNIRWDFVEEVLIKKGFDSKLRGWIMSTVRGGGQSLCQHQWGEWAIFQNSQGVETGGASVPAPFQYGCRCIGPCD